MSLPRNERIYQERAIEIYRFLFAQCCLCHPELSVVARDDGWIAANHVYRDLPEVEFIAVWRRIALLRLRQMIVRHHNMFLVRPRRRRGVEQVEYPIYPHTVSMEGIVLEWHAVQLEVQDLEVLLRALNEREQRMIRLRFWEDLSAEQIAILEGLSVSRVFAILKQAITAMRELAQRDASAA